MMQTLTLQQPLIETLEQVAESQNTSAEILLNKAVTEFLEKVNREKISLESEAFIKLHSELITKYMNEYVAIHHGEVVDHDVDVRTLHLRIRKQFGRIPVLLRLVTEQKVEPDLVFRSPKLEELQQ
jgi:hypothetical protein